jgi:hypothetical protein
MSDIEHLHPDSIQSIGMNKEFHIDVISNKSIK